MATLSVRCKIILRSMLFVTFRLRPRRSVKFTLRQKRILDYDLEQHLSLGMAVAHQEAPFRLEVGFQ
jgi:hypothetical protein